MNIHATFTAIYTHVMGFSGGSDEEEPACHAGEPGFNPWFGKISLAEAMAAQSSILTLWSSVTEEPGRLKSTGPQSETTE